MREKYKWRVIFIVVLSFAIALPATSVAAKKPIKIGVVLPLSGGFEIYGNLGVRGAKMAVAEINAAGGVLDGRPLELIIEDNKTDPKTAVEKAKKLILRDKVVAVDGAGEQRRPGCDDTGGGKI